MHVQIIFQNFLNYHNWNSQLVKTPQTVIVLFVRKYFTLSSILLTGGCHQNLAP